MQLSSLDAIIQAPGFEDRTTALAELLQPSIGARAVLLDYRPVNNKNRLKDVVDLLKERNVLVDEGDVLVYDRFDPGDFQQRITDRLLALGIARVVVDVSSMSKLAIMLVLEACRQLEIDVTVFYAEAEKYGPTQQEFETAKQMNELHRPSLQVFTGVHGVVRVDSLASVAMQGQPTAAIVFMSFNDSLTQVLLNTVYPSRLFLINGRPPLHRWREEATAWIHDQVRREWAEDNPVTVSESGSLVPKRVASTLDYRQTVDLLLRLYWQLSSAHRVLLAPSGSKMQAVACLIAKALHPDIHIEYPSPEGFLPEYSTGIAARWTLPLGNLSQRISEVASLERQQFLEIQLS
jgi:hypothetical protein